MGNQDNRYGNINVINGMYDEFDDNFGGGQNQQNVGNFNYQSNSDLSGANTTYSGATSYGGGYVSDSPYASAGGSQAASYTTDSSDFEYTSSTPDYEYVNTSYANTSSSTIYANTTTTNAPSAAGFDDTSSDEEYEELEEDEVEDSDFDDTSSDEEYEELGYEEEEEVEYDSIAAATTGDEGVEFDDSSSEESYSQFDDYEEEEEEEEEDLSIYEREYDTYDSYAKIDAKPLMQVDNTSIEEDPAILKLRYRSLPFETRIRLVDGRIKAYYSEIKNLLLSHKDVKSRISKKYDTFTVGRFVVARIAVKSGTLKLYLALQNDTLDRKYYTQDVSKNKSYADTPTLHTVSTRRNFKYAQELINMILDALSIPLHKKFEPIDYTKIYPNIDYEQNRLAIAPMIKPVVDEEYCMILPNEQAYDCLENIKTKRYKINKFYQVHKYCLFVDQIDSMYSAYENVNITSLVAKGVLPADETNIFLEIRARGELSKPLNVQAHSFDMNSIKMILLAGGVPQQYKK